MHKIYFIEEKNLNEYSEKPLSVILRWFSLSEIIFYPLRFSETFLNYTSLVNIEEHLNYPKKNYAVINCESLSIWNNVYEGLYQGYFQKPHEQWLSFNVTKGIFPNEDEIKKINGWIISGSDFSVYDETLVWLKDLFLLINDIIKIKGENARILGICFGHQALAQALGGKCEKMKNFLQMLTVKQNVIFNGKFWSKDFVKRSEISKKLLNKEGVLLNQSHGDHVCKLPPNAELFGSLIFYNTI